MGSALFRQLYDVSKEALAGMASSGMPAAGADQEARAAVFLVNDLAVLILRHHIAEVLGVDPLSAPGVKRWTTEVLSIYRDGLGTATERA